MINKTSLATACRRLISRYLAYEFDIDINEKKKLYYWILKEELWSKEIQDLEEYYKQFGNSLPNEIIENLNSIKQNLI